MFINRNVSFRRKSIDFTVITGIKLKYMKPKGDIKMNKCECEHHCHCHDAVENCECGNCKEGTCKCQDGCACGVIMQKKTVSAVTAKQEIAIVMSM